MSDKILVGEKIRNLRTEKGMSINGLAEKVGVTKGYISHIEVGRKRTISVDIINKIAEVFDMKTSELLNGTKYRVETIEALE